MGNDKSKAKLDPNTERKIEELTEILGESLHVAGLINAILVDLEFARGLRNNKDSIDEKVAYVINYLILGMGITANTVKELSFTPGLKTKDCYPLARTVLETSVNVSYILAMGRTAAKQAISHANQKIFRDMERASSIANSQISLVFSGKKNIEVPNEISELLQEFTSRSGREKGWIDLSIDKRIEEASKVLGEDYLTKMHLARFAIYRHSSEIIHGSLFGAMHFFGKTVPLQNDKESIASMKNIGDQHLLLLLATTLCVTTTVESFNTKYGFPDGIRRIKNLQIRMSKLVEVDSEGGS